LSLLDRALRLRDSLRERGARFAQRSRSFAMRHRATAFTLVELLAVIAIIGVLLALLLPALQSSREASRRTACQNNLHQIGLAMQGYHASRRAFPPGGIEVRANPSETAKRQLAWCAFILPQLGEQSIYAQLDLSQPFDSSANAAGAATVLTVFVCPDTRRAVNVLQGRGACNYGGMFGERITSPNKPPKGAMIYDVALVLKDISDGASRTILIAEDRDFPDDQWINALNVFDQAFAINAAPAIENDMGSYHPGGAHALFADSSVHFLRDGLAVRILAALCTRAGNEPVTSFE